MKAPLLACALLASIAAAQLPTFTTAPSLLELSNASTNGGWPFDRVIHDEPGDGCHWAYGASWKASFGKAGFTFLPYFPGARRNAPVHLRLQELRAGELEIPIDARVAPAREGDRVIFARGAVREIYDLSLHHVEQSFVVDTALPGDLELAIAIETELREDPERPGLQFAGEHGEMHYGDAFVVVGAEKIAIEATYAGGLLRLRIPAALRGDGPVVIDPILSSQSGAAPNVLASPDAAFDAAHQRYLLVWEVEFSEIDHDVLCIGFDAAGQPIASSAGAIDATGTFYTHPRVANVHESTTFLVVAAVNDPQENGRSLIYGRRKEAGGSMLAHAPQRISDPGVSGEHVHPDVGGDPGTLPGLHRWLVAWMLVQGSSSAGVEGRLLRSDGQLVRSSSFPIQSAQSGARYSDVQVSRSNGSGIVAAPHWAVAYGRTGGATASDAVARRVDVAGNVMQELLLDVSGEDDRRPQVSSPANLGAGGTGFLFTWDRPSGARAALVQIQLTATLITPYDLSASFGMGRFTPRAESDGARFLVTASDADPFLSTPDQTRAWTLAWNGVRLFAQEGPTTLPGVVTETEIAALRSSGGAAGEYAIAHLRLNGLFEEPVLTRYAGRTAGSMFQVVATGCQGLGLQATGAVSLGGELDFTLQGLGADSPAFVLGTPSTTAIPLCTGCSLGLRLELPHFAVQGIGSMSVAIPNEAWLVGRSIGVQGLAFGPSPCLGVLRLSDTVVMTVR